MKLNLRAFLLICLFPIFSCSEVQKSSEQEFDIYISEKLSIDLHKSGISSGLPFEVAPISGSPQKFLLNHAFGNSLDTLIFDHQKRYGGNIVKGVEIPKEGPNGIDFFHFFIPFGSYFIFMDNTSVYLSKDEVLEKFVFGNSDIGKEKGISSIQGSSNPLSQLISKNFEHIYFFSEDFYSGKIELFAFDLNSETFSQIDFQILESIEEHVIEFNQQTGGKMAKVKNYFYPDVLIIENGFIVFYPYCADFQFYSFSSKTTETIKPNSGLFKTAKGVLDVKSGKTDFGKFIEIYEAWDNDIKFGPIYPLGDRYIFRIVRGELSKDKSSRYLELFDLTFKKVLEVDISLIEPDLSSFYFPIGDFIFIKANLQPQEEVLNYYIIELKSL